MEMTTLQTGAAAAIAALKSHQDPLEGTPDDTLEDSWRAKAAALDDLLAAAGPLPAQAEGAYRALCELLVFNAQGLGDANLDVFVPDVLLTPTEVAERRADLLAQEAAGWPLDPPRNNVLTFPAVPRKD